MPESPIPGPDEKPTKAQFAQLARQLLCELLEYDAVLARMLWQRGLDLDEVTGRATVIVH